MTPLAASIIGYVFGFVTGVLFMAVVLIARGGDDMRAHEQREVGHRR